MKVEEIVCNSHIAVSSLQQLSHMPVLFYLYPQPYPPPPDYFKANLWHILSSVNTSAYITKRKYLKKPTISVTWKKIYHKLSNPHSGFPDGFFLSLSLSLYLTDETLLKSKFKQGLHIVFGWSLAFYHLTIFWEIISYQNIKNGFIPFFHCRVFFVGLYLEFI